MGNLCQCGCGLPAPVITKSSRARGYVKGEHFRFINGHNSRRPLASRYTVDTSTGCWIWNGLRTKDGYSHVMSIGRKQTIAHRLFYERTKGPIPAGLVLDHLCRNRACVNPDHLEPVTQRENVRRSARYFKTEQLCQML